MQWFRDEIRRQQVLLREYPIQVLQVVKRRWSRWLLRRRDAAKSVIPIPISKQKPGAHRWLTRRVTNASALGCRGIESPQISVA